MGVDPGRMPGSVEISPETASPDKIALLKERGVFRISMGVQSFVEAEAAAVRRRQQNPQVVRAIELVRASGIPTLNLDLMYGLPEQNVASALASVRAALEHAPEELYLYPLYVRPLTILGKRADAPVGWDEERISQYRAMRALLRAEGYAQVSMRMFRRLGARVAAGPPYRCQADGMIGLGCGARSYTEGLHYSTAYAVGVAGVRDILHRFVTMPDEEHDVVRFGFVLDERERRRRFVILSLLSDEGLSISDYRERFGGDPMEDIPELLEVVGVRAPEPLVVREGPTLKLTAFGFERSDQIGPYLASARARALAMESERK
jgi:oxygen-independent coproporphyrinogen III oxidase